MCIYHTNKSKQNCLHIYVYTDTHVIYANTQLTYSFNKSTTHCLIIYMLIFKKFCPYIMHWDIKKNIFTVEILAI